MIKSDYFDNAAIVQDNNQRVLNYVPTMNTIWSDKMKHVIILSETAAGWFMCIKIDWFHEVLCFMKHLEKRRFYIILWD